MVLLCWRRVNKDSTQRWRRALCCTAVVCQGLRTRHCLFTFVSVSALTLPWPCCSKADIVTKHVHLEDVTRARLRRMLHWQLPSSAAAPPAETPAAVLGANSDDEAEGKSEEEGSAARTTAWQVGCVGHACVRQGWKGTDSEHLLLVRSWCSHCVMCGGDPPASVVTSSYCRCSSPFQCCRCTPRCASCSWRVPESSCRPPASTRPPNAHTPGPKRCCCSSLE